jgi:hypothetical protein
MVTVTGPAVALVEGLAMIAWGIQRFRLGWRLLREPMPVEPDAPAAPTPETKPGGVIPFPTRDGWVGVKIDDDGIA